MKPDRDSTTASSGTGSDGDKMMSPGPAALQATRSFFRAREELAVTVILGTLFILSVWFFLACLRSMLPVDGLLNANGVRVGNDFIVFYSSALLSMKGEAVSVYDLSLLSAFELDKLGISSAELPWRYPPFYLYMLLPFTCLGYLGAYWTWSVLSILGLMIIVRRITPIWFAPLLVPLCMPVAYTMAAGQNGNLTAILIGAGLLMLNKHAGLSGVLFGLLAYKPQLAAVIPFCLLAGRYYRTFTYMIITVIALVITSLYIYGPEPWIAFLHGLMDHTNTVFGNRYKVWERIPTVGITSLQLFDSARIAMAFQVGAAMTAIMVVFWVWRVSTLQSARALSLVAAIPLISPYVWDYDMAMLVIPIAFLASGAWKDKWTAGRFLLLISMWVAEPLLRIISGKIGLQLGPSLWAVLLGYSIILVKQVQGREAGLSGSGIRTAP